MSHLSARVLELNEVSGVDLAAWALLESRAIEPNAFLSPYFVIPAARHLAPGDAPRLVFVERTCEGTRDLVGVGAFTEVPASRQVPVRRLVGYRSRHSFLGGVLLDRKCAAEAMAELLRFVGRSLPQCKAIELPRIWADGQIGGPEGAIQRVSPFEVHTSDVFDRAILVPSEVAVRLHAKPLSKQVADLDRRMRRLREQGHVRWTWHWHDGIPPDTIEAFLSLEHMGWKGEGGTSLRSRPSDEAFFREMVAGFAIEKRILFTELWLDEEPVASRCFLLSGHAGFYFKLGWNPEYRSYSPALINDLEFMRSASAQCTEVRYFDSGAGPEAFINDLWPWRRPLSTVTIPCRPIGALVLTGMTYVRRAKRWANAKVVSVESSGRAGATT